MSGSDIELRWGRWQDVLADVGEVDALIVDAPYSEKTHAGHDNGTGAANRPDNRPNVTVERRALNYAAWSPEDVADFVASWAPRTRGWFVTITDNELAPVWARALEAAGRYSFSPLAFVAPGSRVRLSGDGPAQWSTWVVVARPRALPFAKWGALPGAYVLPKGQTDPSFRPGADRAAASVVGGKPLWLMRALVRDYSRAGDLVCDPCAGSGTTLVAASIEGRRAIGAECLREHFELATRRIKRGYTPTFDFGNADDAEALP